MGYKEGEGSEMRTGDLLGPPVFGSDQEKDNHSNSKKNGSDVHFDRHLYAK